MVITKEINSVDIDKESLVSLLKEKGVSLAQASMKIGYSSTYLTKAVSTEKIREAAVQLLEMTYGISRKDFQRKDPPPRLVGPLRPQQSGYWIHSRLENYAGQAVLHRELQWGRSYSQLVQNPGKT